MKLSTGGRQAVLTSLQTFLEDKSVGGAVAAECIEAYRKGKLDDTSMGYLRDELKSIRDAADFALRQLKNI
jgi:hypothetical protein